MEILQGIDNLKHIVEARAKYQKVMLVYDQNLSNLQQTEIYNQIKEICIFNKMEYNQNLQEIYNGYKLIIFCLSANSFLKLNYDLEEFVSVFIAQDEQVLPFYLNNSCCLSNSERYLIPTKNYLDTNAIASMQFNNFFCYINKLLNFSFGEINTPCLEQEITQTNILQAINSYSSDIEFVDIKIAKQMQMEYSTLAELDFTIICAFICLVTSVLTNTLELVDTYKVAKDSNDLIDKLYAMQSNTVVVKSIELNANFLLKAAHRAKQNVVSLICDVREDNITHVISKIKDYAKQANGLIGYFYLYNIFGY